MWSVILFSLILGGICASSVIPICPFAQLETGSTNPLSYFSKNPKAYTLNYLIQRITLIFSQAFQNSVATVGGIGVSGLLPLSLEMFCTSVSQMVADSPPVGGCFVRPAVTVSNISLPSQARQGRSLSLYC